MPRYVVEAYVPRSRGGEVSRTAARARRAAQDLARSGAAVRYVRTTFLPEDELCMLVLEAPSMEIARDAADRASIPYQRIVEAVERVPRVLPTATRLRAR